MKKRLVSFLLAISMVLTFLPVSAITAFAANDDTTLDGKTYDCGKTSNTVTATLTRNTDGDDTYTLTISGAGEMANYDYRNGTPWEENTSKITTVVIGEGVTSIGSYAFENCSQLSSVTIPDGVTSIGEYIFSGCNSLTSVKIPESVESISVNAFGECKTIESITTSADAHFFARDGVLYEKTSEGNTLQFYPVAKNDLTFEIPNYVTSIGTNAFAECKNLTNVTIPNNVTSIGEYAFRKCTALKSVTIPATVASIAKRTFENCNALESVTIEGSIASIGEFAFAWCNQLSSVTIPNSVTTIESNAFYGCSELKKVYYTGTSDDWTAISSNFPSSAVVYYVHSVTFKDGNNILETKFTDDEGKIIAPQKPTKEGYTFVGWSTDGTNKDWTEKELFNPNNSITENTTLYAVWKRVPATLDMTVAQGEHKVNEPVTVNVTLDPGDYRSEIFSGNVSLAFADADGKDAKDAVSEVKLNNKTLTEEQLNALTTNGCSIAQLMGTGTIQSTTIPLAVTFSKAGTYNVKIELKDNADNVLCSDTAQQIKVVEKEPATLSMTVAQGEHKVKESVKVKVSVTPNDYGRDLSSCKIVMTYDDDVASVELKGRELKDKSYGVSTLASAGAFEPEGTAMTATLDVTYTKPGKHEFTVEIKNGEDVLCSDTATIEIAKEEEKPTNPEKPADSEKPEPKPEEPETPVTKLYDLTVKNAEVTIADADGKAVETTKNEDGTLTAKVPEKAAVTVKYTAPTDAIVFDLWSITSDAKLDVNVKENPLTFTMPDKAVTVEAMTRDATIESEGPGVLGYQGYMIGTELYLKNVMPAGATIPTNTAELAKLVWNDAGCPEPVALLAADATDEQKALTWAVENQLISADKAADASVTRWEVIQTWNKEQEMKKA